MSEKVVFWYGCNAIRHGDIIHSAIALLNAVGVETDVAGGPAYWCSLAPARRKARPRWSATWQLRSPKSGRMY